MPEANKPRHGAKNQIQPQTPDQLDALKRQQEATKRLQAAYRRVGYELACVELKDGTQNLYATNWGFCRPLAGIEEARIFLELIGGGHG